MKLNDVLAITKFSEHDHYEVSVLTPDGKKCEAFFAVWHHTAPDYAGKIYSKTHREEIKKTKAMLKKYGDYEIDQIKTFGNIHFYLTAKEDI